MDLSSLNSVTPTDVSFGNATADSIDMNYGAPTSFEVEG
jgi:hypothetical protein